MAKPERPTVDTRETILAFCRANMDASSQDAPEDTNDPRSANNWTVEDLFLRQYINNMSDGFGLFNVSQVYDYLISVKAQLVQYKLISKEGKNNSGYTLWENYDIDKFATMDPALRAECEKRAAMQRAMVQMMGMLG
jgi:hypothetical protein